MSKKVAVQLITLFLLLYTRGVGGKHFFYGLYLKQLKLLIHFYFYVYSTFASYFFILLVPVLTYFAFVFIKLEELDFEYDGIKGENRIKKKIIKMWVGYRQAKVYCLSY